MNVKQLCDEYHLTPAKAYGQHFLISNAPIRAMIEVSELTKDDTVIEIGPGFGILTLALAPLVKKVIAFEIEKKLQPYWEEKQKEYPNVEMVWGNALKLITTYNLKPKTYKVLANLPYQITSPVIRLFLEAEYKPERMVIMVQKEVAERICAAPGDMSLLAVSAQYYSEPKIIAPVPRGNFWPQPKVDSAIVSITLPPNHLTTSPPLSDEAFFRLVKAGFAHKRKQLWRNLASGLKLDAALVKAMLREVVGNEKVRAEELGVDKWRRLAAALKRY